MRYRIQLTVLLLLASIFSVRAQGDTTMTVQLATDAQALAFMVGDWEVTSRQMVDDSWQESQGIARIEPVLNRLALLETYMSVQDETRYEATIFRGVRDDQGAWDVAWADTGVIGFCAFDGMTHEDGTFTAENNFGCENYHTEIEMLSDTTFRWSLLEITEDDEPVLIWTRDYERLTDETAFDTEAETLRDMPTMQEAPAAMDEFSFWHGEWRITSTYRVAGLPGLPAQDTVAPVNNGHALMELWRSGSDQFPLDFFTLTVWDDTDEQYINWYWGTSRRSASINEGFCEGEGADKICRLAGTFHDITEDSFEWYLGEEDDPIWTMSFERVSE